MDSLKLILKIFLITLLAIGSLFIPRLPFLNFPKFYHPYIGSQDWVLSLFIVLAITFILLVIFYKNKIHLANKLFWPFFLLVNIFWWPFSTYCAWYMTSQQSFGGFIFIFPLILLIFLNIYVFKFIIISIGNISNKKIGWKFLINTAIIIITIVIIISGTIIYFKQKNKSEKPWNYEIPNNSETIFL